MAKQPIKKVEKKVEKIKNTEKPKELDPWYRSGTYKRLKNV